MEANAALRTIVRRDSGETYRQMLTQMAKESGVETPTIDDLVRLDRKRKGKKLSNKDWTSPTDPDAKIARMKDGTTHLAYKPEHAVDLDTGVIVAAPIRTADEGDTTTLPGTLEAAARNLAEVGLAPTQAEPCVLVGDKGYHSREGLKDLDGGVWKTRISEPEPANGYLRWHGDEAARQAVYANRARLKSGVGRNAMRKRSEMVERSFAHVLDRGGMRRAWLRGRENVHKRYLIHVAGFNLGIRCAHCSDQARRGRLRAQRAPFCSLFSSMLPWRSPSWRTSKANQQYSSSSSHPKRIDQKATSSPG